jgi:hypothetical protein
MTRADQHSRPLAFPVDEPESSQWEVEVHFLGLTARFGGDAPCS